MDAIDYKTLGREAMHDSMKKGLATTLLAGATSLVSGGLAPVVLGGGRASSLLDTYRSAKNNVAASVMEAHIPKIDGRLAALNALNESHSAELLKLKNSKVPNIKKYLPAAAAVGIGAPAALGEIQHLEGEDKEKKAFVDPLMASLVGGGALATTLLMNMRGARKGIEEGKANVQAKQQELNQVEQQHGTLTKEVEQAKITSNGFGSLRHPGTWAAMAAIPAVGYGAYKMLKGPDKDKQANVIQEDRQMNQLDQVYEQVLMKLASLNGMQKQASNAQFDVIYERVMQKLAAEGDFEEESLKSSIKGKDLENAMNAQKATSSLKGSPDMMESIRNYISGTGKKINEAVDNVPSLQEVGNKLNSYTDELNVAEGAKAVGKGLKETILDPTVNAVQSAMAPEHHDPVVHALSAIDSEHGLHQLVDPALNSFQEPGMGELLGGLTHDGNFATALAGLLGIKGIKDNMANQGALASAKKSNQTQDLRLKSLESSRNELGKSIAGVKGQVAEATAPLADRAAKWLSKVMAKK